jgi:phospholipid-transporting ATPase
LQSVSQNLQSGHPTAPFIREFLILMSVCHTVIPEKAYSTEIQYHAASPGRKLLRAGIFI